MSQDDKTDLTQAKTLWSETILEILYEALRKERKDGEIRELLKEVRAKGFKRDYILDRVKKKIGPAAEIRVRGLLGPG